MTTRREIERRVAMRAVGRCEYCRMHQSLQGATFHVPTNNCQAAELELTHPSQYGFRGERGIANDMEWEARSE